MSHDDPRHPDDLPHELLAPLRDLFDDRTLELPVLPEKLAELMALCGSEEPSIERITELVSYDQSLAAHVLRLAGSASMASVVEVRSLPEAVRRVGIRAIGDMAISHLTQECLGTHPHPRLRELMGRAAAAGVYAYRIGCLTSSSGEASLLPGLMHDIGRPLAIRTLLDAHDWTGVELTMEVIELLAEDLHVELGVRLARSWNLPLSVEVAVRYHEDPDEAPAHAEHARVAALADLLARWTLEPETAADAVLPELRVVLELGLQERHLGRLIGNLVEVREVAASYA